ncbi:hypothetical protein ACNR9Q_12160 [Maribacter sp. X9]|uniref:hypothetical protein n=1 Tax=Maribacter sp. X9 TaxID=3402159 RepID=UPI003AF33C9E
MKNAVKFLSLLTFFLILSSCSDDDDTSVLEITTVVGKWVQTNVTLKYKNPSNGNTIESAYDLTDLCDPKPVAIFQENGKLTYMDIMIEASVQQEITCESTNKLEGEWKKINENTYRLIFGGHTKEINISFIDANTMIFDISEGTGEGSITLERQ